MLTFFSRQKSTGQIVAVKIIDLEEAEDDLECIKQEVFFLSQLNCPNIIKYYGSFLKEQKLWIVMGYLGGGAVSDLLKLGPLDERYIAIILREVLRGLAYLHSQKKLHRDIKGMKKFVYGNKIRSV